MNATTHTKNAIRNSVANNLDTRDKRFMFLKLVFPDMIHNIQIEGTAKACAVNIVDHFDKCGMLGSLCAVMNTYFNAEIDFEIIK